MLFFVPVTVFVLFFVLIRSKMGAASGPSAARGLAGGRVLARGLVLSASPFVSGERTQNGQRYELRDLLLDVEVQGQAPYEVSVTPLIPRICEARPGAALDLSLDPRNPSDVVVIGPAGASAWIWRGPLAHAVACRRPDRRWEARAQRRPGGVPGVPRPRPRNRGPRTPAAAGGAARGAAHGVGVLRPRRAVLQGDQRGELRPVRRDGRGRVRLGPSGGADHCGEGSQKVPVTSHGRSPRICL